MGLKYTVETIGELKKAIALIPEDVTFQCEFDGTDYRKLDVQLCYDFDPEARFVKFTLPED
jgi:hypothetical protein